jgi:aminobenzoyl-glutamate utilization protein A
LRERVIEQCHEEFARAFEMRRDLHAHPELGWTEFRTASRSAAALAAAGWDVRVGAAVCAPAGRMGVPPESELNAAWQDALANGGDAGWLEPMRGGLTGVVAELRGNQPGPTVAMRFDMDALPLLEAADDGHRPAREGFVSTRPGVMHACGHDAHTALGVALGSVLARVREQLRGTLQIILQPAEEGTRGAAAMVAAGALDAANYFLCPHVGATSETTGEIVPGVSGFLATVKLDAWYRGEAAHAGLAPEQGRNALLGAAQAALGLHAIARHSAGNSRVNVGVLRAGSGRNIIPAEAQLKLELRGEQTAVTVYLEQEALRVLAGAAAMWGLEHGVERVGAAPSAASDEAVMAVVRRVAGALPSVTQVSDTTAAAASDDATAMMRHVQERGGQAAYVILGTRLAGGHHNERFDIDEECLLPGLQVFALSALELTGSLGHPAG